MCSQGRHGGKHLVSASKKKIYLLSLARMPSDRLFSVFRIPEKKVVVLMRPVRVLLAARKKDLRVRLRRILSAEKTGVVHVGEAANGSKAIKLVSQASPDVIVISLDLSGPESMELIRRIKELEPATRILVLSDEINKDKIMQLFDSGISGFSTISEASEHLVSGIHACMNLVVWLSPIVHERLFKDYSE